MVTIILDGKKRHLEEDNDLVNILCLKKMIESQLGVPYSEQKILYKGKIMKDLDEIRLNKTSQFFVVREQVLEREIVNNPTLCKNKPCKFWGVDEFDSMCSICYKKSQEQLYDEKMELKEELIVKEELMTNEKSCFQCKTTKMSYMIMECKCGHFYCQKHLFHKNHNCEYNYFEDTKIKMKENAEKSKKRKYENIYITPLNN